MRDFLHKKNSMKLGYIHTNKDEQARVMQVMNLLEEKVALDELGIGRIRDAFSDLMFPGISTLQKHMKYFSLMPQLYKKATEKKYNRLSEVRTEVVRLERLMTKNLVDGSPKKTAGITGREVIGKNRSNYVKYDPAYIYNSGLQTFGILRNSQLFELIYATSKHLHAQPQKYKSEDEDSANDAEDKIGLYQFCSFPIVNYDFTRACSIALTPEDKAFIVDHITKSKACQGTLLKYLVEHEDLPLANCFPGVDDRELPEDLRIVQKRARQFADFIYVIHLRYNCIYSETNGTRDEKMFAKFAEEHKRYKESGINIDEVLNMVTLRENSSKKFCKEAAELLTIDNLTALDECIVRRERRVKGTRRKIGNQAYSYDPKYPVHDNKLSFRWETVRAFIEELRGKEANNGRNSV